MLGCHPEHNGSITMQLMGGCQNDGLFLGTLNIRCRIIIGIQKGTIILTITLMEFEELLALCVSSRLYGCQESNNRTHTSTTGTACAFQNMPERLEYFGLGFRV